MNTKVIVEGEEMDCEVVSIEDFFLGIENALGGVPESSGMEDVMKESYEQFIANYLIVKML